MRLAEVTLILASASGLPPGSRTVPVSAAVVLLWAMRATGAATSARKSELNRELPEFLVIAPPGAWGMGDREWMTKN
jgi:hypothetical protein